MQLSFRAKLYVPLVISWLGLVGVASFNIAQSKSQRLEERQIALRYATDVGMSTVKEYADQVASGALTLPEAKAQALQRLKAMRYGKDGYYTVVNSEPKMLMHPIKPQMIGKDLYDFKDAQNNYVYRDAVSAAKSSSGEGWIDYVWPKPGEADQTKVYPKGAYVAAYKPWDWVFISGVYMDDLTDAFVRDLWRAGAMLGVLGLLLSGVITLVARSVEKAIGGDPDHAAEVARRISEGDLTVLVQTLPEDRSSLMYAMHNMQQSLVGIVSKVRSGTDSIATASGQIAVGNNDLSSRTEAQASSLEQTAAAMEEITATVKQNADNAHQANQLAASASDVAVKGGAVVSQVVDTMGEINNSSRKIVDIIAVIDGIAFQTNILALNAAVEAARAGEQGRGFAVVASEVRTLAQRSADAAKQIKTLIGDSVAKVDEGGRLVAEAGQTMGDIVSSVKRVSDIISEITSAGREQTSGIEQVNLAIAQMDQATQQNAALVEEAAAAAQSLQQQAAGLAEVVTIFKL